MQQNIDRVCSNFIEETIFPKMGQRLLKNGLARKMGKFKSSDAYQAQSAAASVLCDQNLGTKDESHFELSSASHKEKHSAIHSDYIPCLGEVCERAGKKTPT